MNWGDNFDLSWITNDQLATIATFTRWREGHRAHEVRFEAVLIMRDLRELGDDRATDVIAALRRDACRALETMRPDLPLIISTDVQSYIDGDMPDRFRRMQCDAAIAAEDSTWLRHSKPEMRRPRLFYLENAEETPRAPH